MKRRSFFGSLIAGVAGLFAGSTAEAKPVTTVDPWRFKRAFQWDGEHWKELAWEAMIPDTEYLVVCSSDGNLVIECLTIECHVPNAYEPEDNGVKIKQYRGIFPSEDGSINLKPSKPKREQA